MSIVVSDTSPIRALAHLELLPLLGELYDEVVIPPAVFDELTRKGKRFTPLSPADLALFRLREPALDVPQTAEFLELDAGEREAIRLALELSADGLLIDEHCGRQVATAFGLRVTGTLILKLCLVNSSFAVRSPVRRPNGRGCRIAACVRRSRNHRARSV